MTATTRLGPRITMSATGHVAVVAPSGDLAGEDWHRLEQALREAADGPELLVVDLLDVASVDAAVVGVLVRASARCASAGARLLVANAAAQPWLALTRAHVAGVVKAHRRTGPPLAELLELLAD